MLESFLKVFFWKPLTTITKGSILDVAAVLDPPLLYLVFDRIYLISVSLDIQFDDKCGIGKLLIKVIPFSVVKKCSACRKFIYTKIIIVTYINQFYLIHTFTLFIIQNTSKKKCLMNFVKNGHLNLLVFYHNLALCWKINEGQKFQYFSRRTFEEMIQLEKSQIHVFQLYLPFPSPFSVK